MMKRKNLKSKKQRDRKKERKKENKLLKKIDQYGKIKENLNNKKKNRLTSEKMTRQI